MPPRMRLGGFILANIEPILAEWEAFARTITPGAKMEQLALRDHAEDILRATARDMDSAQTPAERSDKSHGHGHDSNHSRQLNGASQVHAVTRVHSGFDLLQVVAEYRALRASVVRLWRESLPNPDRNDIDDITRFDESIDQSLTRAVGSFTSQVDRSRQMFLAMLGHDLRNPLNSILLLAQAQQRTDKHDPEYDGMAARIVSSAHAMTRLIHDLLDFTAAGLGAAMPLSPAPMDLRRLCAAVIDEMRGANPGRAITFDAPSEVRGEWDPARLRQVVSNLLGNALQHGAGTGPVTVMLKDDISEIVFTVHNEGPPIPADALPTIFNPLIRGTSPELQKQRRPGSMGLGLYIAREVVTGHGGTITVESSAQAGTRFTLRLPRKPGR